MTTTKEGTKQCTKKVFKRCDRNAMSGVKKNCWTIAEDEKLLRILNEYDLEREGKIRWTSIAVLLSGRNSKQIRERWLNHLRPDLKKGEWSKEEEISLFELQGRLGNKWKAISQILRRSDNDIKNRWNSKGYSHYHNFLQRGTLRTTISMLTEHAATMSPAERASHVASLRSLGGIPEEILAPFEPSAQKGPRTRKKWQPIAASRSTGTTLTDTTLCKVNHESRDHPWVHLRSYGKERGGHYNERTLEPGSSQCPSQTFLERSISWAAGLALLENYDSPFDMAAAERQFPRRRSSENPDMLAESIRNRQDEATSSAGSISNARSPPTVACDSYSVESHTFLGRTFFSPGVHTPGNSDSEGVISPFGECYCV